MYMLQYLSHWHAILYVREAIKTRQPFLDACTSFGVHHAVTIRRRKPGLLVLNQGATCYMNSLIQYLYCTNFSRKVSDQSFVKCTPSNLRSRGWPANWKCCFGITTSILSSTNIRPTSWCVPLTSVGCGQVWRFAGTTELTKSFGWKSLDSFLQHDVQEFNRVLQDKLESKMKVWSAFSGRQ